VNVNVYNFSDVHLMVFIERMNVYFIAYLNIKIAGRLDIEDITWARGDTNFIFEC